MDIEVQDNDKEWVGMPEFIQENNRSYQKLIIRFRNKDDVDKFAELISAKITPKTKSLWFPKLERGVNSGKRWVDENDA